MPKKWISSSAINEAFGSDDMVKSLRKLIIRMYSMGACATLGMNNQDALSEDLESDPFLNSTLQRFTCELYYKFGSFLTPLSIGLITSRHYFSEWNVTGTKNGGTNGPALKSNMAWVPSLIYKNRYFAIVG